MTRLRKHLSLGNLLALPPASTGYRGTLAEQLQLVKSQGYESLQSWDNWRVIQDAGLRASGIARLQHPDQAAMIAEAHADAGLEFTNLHVGTGFESDAAMDALADSILQASARTGHRLLVETHRATATQDIWRTLRWIERFPELRFTADLSHWYTGHELTYGGEFEQRMAHLQPVFDPAATVVYAAGRGDVTDVWVGGAPVVRDRRPMRVDPSGVTAELAALRARVLATLD